MTADFAARGLARQSSQKLSSTLSGEGAAMVGYHAGGTATGTRFRIVCAT